jgi:hypothetical protein
MGVAVNELPALASDRLKKAIFAFIRELFPTLDFYRPHLYVVALWSFGAQTGDLIPHASAKGMPSLGSVSIRSPGITFDLSPGQEVVVMFDNGDPTRPFIAHLDNATAFIKPTFLGLAGASQSDPAVARVGDHAGTLEFIPGSSGAVLKYNGTPLAPSTPVDVTISSGSPKVSSL